MIWAKEFRKYADMNIVPCFFLRDPFGRVPMKVRLDIDPVPQIKKNTRTPDKKTEHAEVKNNRQDTVSLSTGGVRSIMEQNRLASSADIRDVRKAATAVADIRELIEQSPQSAAEVHQFGDRIALILSVQ